MNFDKPAGRKTEILIIDGMSEDGTPDLVKKFADENGGGFYYTAADQEKLIVRNKDYPDNAVPSGNSMAVTAMIRLGKLTGKQA